jgi:putative lipoprotein
VQLVKGLAVALLVACLLDPGSSRAADPDPWFGRDKALHFTATATLASGGYGAAAALGDNRRWRFVTGATVGLGAGIAKEALDATGAGDASWRDLTWDAIGTATGLALAALIDWLWARAVSPPQGAGEGPLRDPHGVV